jgi:hypothetical protein
LPIWYIAICAPQITRAANKKLIAFFYNVPSITLLNSKEKFVTALIARFLFCTRTDICLLHIFFTKTLNHFLALKYRQIIPLLALFVNKKTFGVQVCMP